MFTVTHLNMSILSFKHYKMMIIDTGGLSYEITLSVNKIYIIISNVNVTDNLENSTLGTLVHIKYDDGEMKRV